MRKFLLLLCLTVFLPGFIHAEAPSAERITSYGVVANLNDNATLDVTETIRYDFGKNEKHGIFRYIPAVYKGRLGNPRQSVKITSVTNESGASQEYKLSSEGDSKVIKIGNEFELISGIHTYVIKYSINHMISSEPGGDRFRWDAIGTGWTVPINNVVVKVTGSDKLRGASKSISCYFGGSGSTDNCDYQVTQGSILAAKDTLPAGSGLTLDSLYNAGTFPAPNALEMFFWETNWYYWLPLVAFIAFFSLWYEKGRDPKGRGTIVPMYDPPKDMNPFEATLVLEEKVSFASLPASIIDLATRGYLKIHKKDTKLHFTTKAEYELEKLRALPSGTSPVDLAVFNLFFDEKDRVSTKELGASFNNKFNKVGTLATKEVLRKGYFAYDPFLTQVYVFCLGVAIAVFGVLLALYFLVGPLGFVVFLAPGAIGLIFAIFMPVRTKAGVLVKEDLLGLKMYIKTAEIDRIKFHNAPAKSPEKFEELLPYAIIFGLEKEWAAEFEDIYKTPPSWYDGNMANFSIIGLSSDLRSFSDSAISSAVNAASSSSGGFSGGGGGGGGGGSW